jgi:putative membrane protein
MKKTALILLAFLGIAVIASSCSKDEESYTMSNQDFVTQASSSNSFEIAAGNLAKTKGANPNVVAYGQHMVTDHTQAAAEMSALVSNKGLTVSTTLMAKDQTNYNQLNSLSGSAFDKQFAAIMVASHQEAVTLFQNASVDFGVPDADLRSFAAGKLPTLKTHLSDAQALQAQVGQP